MVFDYVVAREPGPALGGKEGEEEIHEDVTRQERSARGPGILSLHPTEGNDSSRSIYHLLQYA